MRPKTPFGQTFLKLLRPSFQGRIRRTDFWIGHLSLLGTTIMLIIPLVLVSSGGSSAASEGLIGVGSMAVALVITLVSASVYFRRLHDIGLTGWLGFVPAAPGFLRGIAEGYMPVAEDFPYFGTPWLDGPYLALAIAGALVSFLAAFKPGDPRPNRYGPQPGVGRSDFPLPTAADFADSPRQPSASPQV